MAREKEDADEELERFQRWCAGRLELDSAGVRAVCIGARHQHDHGAGDGVSGEWNAGVGHADVELAGVCDGERSGDYCRVAECVD